MIAWAGMEMFNAGYESDMSILPLRHWSLDATAEDGGILGIEGWRKRDDSDFTEFVDALESRRQQLPWDADDNFRFWHSHDPSEQLRYCLNPSGFRRGSVQEIHPDSKHDEDELSEMLKAGPGGNAAGSQPTPYDLANIQLRSGSKRDEDLQSLVD